MRDATFYASSLLELDTTAGATERRAAWRQSIAALARAAADDGPGPLEGLHPEVLARGVRAALQSGLVDDLDWLAPPAATVALWELASALPIGAEQRELGRRVLARVVEADAETFVAVARRMALGSGKGLGSAAMRARIALVTELPIGLGMADAPLALAIASRRDLAREWVAVPSIGSLASRRMAARLIERAAREAARRASLGDDHSLRVFRGDAVAQAWERLLADRESLVWRHVAVARGLLAPWVPALRQQIEAALAPHLSPTQWRRAAASIAALVAVDPEEAEAHLVRALSQLNLLERDPGAASAFLWGLPRAAEVEPESASELLDSVMKRAGPDIGEAVLDLRAELGASQLGERACKKALAILGGPTKISGDDGAEALALEVARDLEGNKRDDEPLREHIARALEAFATAGAREAYARARDALSAARGSIDALEAIGREEDAAEGRAGSIARRASLSVLRDLDSSLLERDVLAHLLALGGGEAPREAVEALDDVRDRLAEWILAREQTPLGSGDLAHPTLSLRRLRALLHLADGDVDESNAHRSSRMRKRCLRIARALLDRFERDPPSPVRRTIVAALARSLDALVRAGACDVSDALLVVSRHVDDAAEVGTLAEASMDPDLVHALVRYARFAETVSDAGAPAPPADSTPVSVSSAPAVSRASGVAKWLPAFDELARELATDATGRIEALRTVLARLGAAVTAISGATSLRALVPAGAQEPEAIASLETSLTSLAQLAIGARARLDPDRAAAAPAGNPAAMRPLTVAVSRVLSGVDPSLREHIVSASLDDLLAGVPKAIGKLVAAVVWKLVDLPIDPLFHETSSIRISEALPAWLPPRRTIGGFYVLRPLSTGAVGSVFVVTRVEDKSDPGAERFALKVPEYSASAARMLSEAEFLKTFREEAGALIALPQHPNLARFVTFDAGSKPKPILVMELVEGTTLERQLELRDLDTARAMRVLDDVLSGLDAMHGAGVGHLDVKPSNVVLRSGEEAVLVDFGLAGRHIRPGCATGPYGAPEVWGALEGHKDLTPQKSDVYAFGCVAFEILTGRVLFEAPSQMAQIAMHVAHDGFPDPVRALAKRPGLAPLTEFLFATLRRDPRDRPTAAAARSELKRIAPALARWKWPIDAA